MLQVNQVETDWKDDLQRWKTETINSNLAQYRLKRKQAIAEAKLEETKREQRKINRQMKNKME